MKRMRYAMVRITTVSCSTKHIDGIGIQARVPYPLLQTSLGMYNSASQPFWASKRFQRINKMCHNNLMIQDHYINMTNNYGGVRGPNKIKTALCTRRQESLLESFECKQKRWMKAKWERSYCPDWLAEGKKSREGCKTHFWYGLRPLQSS